VSVIIPVLNAQKTLEKCVLSVINQDYPKNRYEIICIDNGSNDASMSILKKYNDSVKILIEKEKSSYAARNKGVKSAKGEIILFTDSDCIADKNWIKNIIIPFKDTNNILVSGNVKAYNPITTIQSYYNNFCHNHKNFSKWCLTTTSNCAIPKKLFFKIGGFNTTLKSGGDLELSHRINKINTEFSFQKNAIVYHIYPDSIINFIKKNFFYGTGNYILRKKNSIKFYTPIIPYLKLMKKYRIEFLFYRIIQDFSFRLGIIYGRIAQSLRMNR